MHRTRNGRDGFTRCSSLSFFYHTLLYGKMNDTIMMDADDLFAPPLPPRSSLYARRRNSRSISIIKLPERSTSPSIYSSGPHSAFDDVTPSPPSAYRASFLLLSSPLRNNRFSTRHSRKPSLSPRSNPHSPNDATATPHSLRSLLRTAKSLPSLRPHKRSKLDLSHLFHLEPPITSSLAHSAHTGAQPVSTGGAPSRRPGSGGTSSPSTYSPGLNPMNNNIGASSSNSPSPIHAAYTAGGPSRNIGAPLPVSTPNSQGYYQSTSPSASSSTGATSYRPGRVAPAPPTSQPLPSQHVLDPSNPQLSRQASNPGAARSSYHPTSGRPPYSSNPSTSSSIQIRPQAPPPVPSSAASSLHAPSAPTSPARRPSPNLAHPPGPNSSLAGGNWEMIDGGESNIKKSQIPHTGSTSLRDLNDALPSHQPHSTNSSTSSLIVNPPIATTTNYNHHPNQRSHYHPHHQQSSSISQSNYSLLHDPATSAATNYSASLQQQQDSTSHRLSQPGGMLSPSALPANGGGGSGGGEGDYFGSISQGGGSAGTPGLERSLGGGGGAGLGSQRNSAEKVPETPGGSTINGTAKEKKSKGFSSFLGAFKLSFVSILFRGSWN